MHPWMNWEAEWHAVQKERLAPRVASLISESSFIAGSQHTRSHPRQGHDLTSKADQDLRDFEKLPRRAP